MCRQVTCRQCKKPDWSGCGAHVEQVLGHIPKEQRCRCREEPAAKEGRSEPSFWSRLFGG